MGFWVQALHAPGGVNCLTSDVLATGSRLDPSLSIPRGEENLVHMTDYPRRAPGEHEQSHLGSGVSWAQQKISRSLAVCDSGGLPLPEHRLDLGIGSGSSHMHQLEPCGQSMVSHPLWEPKAHTPNRRGAIPTAFQKFHPSPAVGRPEIITACSQRN